MTALDQTDTAQSRGILLLILAMVLISINDMLIKGLSDRFPLHQIVLIRSMVAIVLTMVFIRWEGGFRILRTDRPWLHAFRALLLVGANLFYFAALATLPLAEANALFFVAPILITLLQIPILRVQVGPRRILAVLAGFLGVLVILGPGIAGGAGNLPLWALLLPLAAASCYALMQVLTRLLGAKSAASAMAFYVQGTFILVGLGFGFIAGDGRYAEGLDNPSLLFLLRPWIWPGPSDWLLLVSIGLFIAVVGYAIAQAYRISDPATIAPFEYTALPLAVLWGVLFFDDIPGPETLLGIVLIAGAGIFVVLRERRLGNPPPKGPLR
ncbi:DMT family transporter [Ovoidimarina sediminis]|uniref:DMT family transporter n=1 Tax=Ovoidimarina sediminis TaxID=3079856 RepID=UPI0029120224|nr:DMT family transporter [Rhodophyticola sp. MJ-SS7]MDU8942012.1 DMT family transporter [Rhodophyticola sp. MJ-SS7]